MVLDGLTGSAKYEPSGVSMLLGGGGLALGTSLTSAFCSMLVLAGLQAQSAPAP